MSGLSVAGVTQSMAQISEVVGQGWGVGSQ